MTKDFRNVGRLGTTPEAPRSPPAAAARRSIVIAILNGGATLFLLASLWLLSGLSSPLPEDIGRLVGLALVVTAITDFVLAAVLKRRWAKETPP